MPLAITTGPTRISIPARRAPSHARAAAPQIGWRGVRVAVQVTPRPVLPGDRQLALENRVVEEPDDSPRIDNGPGVAACAG